MEVFFCDSAGEMVGKKVQGIGQTLDLWVLLKDGSNLKKRKGMTLHPLT